jgi:hypothetical protein
VVHIGRPVGAVARQLRHACGVLAHATAPQDGAGFLLDALTSHAMRER